MIIEYRNKRMLRTTAVAGLFLLAACAARVETHGNLPDPELLQEIKIGENTRDDVSLLLGTPSTKGVFGQETWLYISDRTETVAFFEPEVVERKVVVLQFDDSGVVSTMETVDLSAGQNIELVDRETPTRGNELTILEQVMGNLGRFNKEGERNR